MVQHPGLVPQVFNSCYNTIIVPPNVVLWQGHVTLCVYTVIQQPASPRGYRDATRKDLVWSCVLLKSHGCGKASIGPAPDSSPLLVHVRIGCDQVPGDRYLVLDLNSAQVSVHLE